MMLRAELMSLEADAFEMVAHAFGALYAILTPEQRLIVEHQWGFGIWPGWGRTVD